MGSRLTHADRRQRCGGVAALLVAVICAGGAARADTPVPLTNPGMEAPYNTVNLNGGAISGALASGWSDNSAWANPTVQYSKETGNPHSGSACQKVVVASAGSGRVQFIQPFPLQTGNLYTASVWLRGTPGAQASLVIQQAASPYATYVQNSIALTSDWQQITATGYIGTTEGAYLMVTLSVPATLWADDFALSFAPASISPTPHIGPVPLSFFGMHVENFLQSQLLNSGFEPPYVSVGVNNPISGNIAVNWTDNSSWGVPNPTVTYSEDAGNPHGGTASQKVSVQNSALRRRRAIGTALTVIPGQVYTLHRLVEGRRRNEGQPGPPGHQRAVHLLRLHAGHALRRLAAVHGPGAGERYGQPPAHVPGSASGNVLGGRRSIHRFHRRPGLRRRALAQVQIRHPAAVGLRNLLDFARAAERACGTGSLSTSGWRPPNSTACADILLTLGQTPPWASTNPDDVNYIGAGAPAPPADIQDWRDYIAAVAQRYKGRIRYYEIWNEPNDNTYYTGTVAELAQLTAEAYRILKAVDPGNTVLSPAAYAPGYLAQLLQAGIGANVDMIAFHFYETPPEATAAAVFNVRMVMAQNGAGAMPLWDTEGASGDTTVPEDLAAAYLVRKYLVDLAFGSVRYDWYAWGKATSFCVGTEENDPRLLTEAGRAFGILLGWLQGASVTGASIDASGTWEIGLTWNGGAFAGAPASSIRQVGWPPPRVTNGVIVWNPAATVQFAIPSTLHQVSQYDVFGHATPVSGTTVTIGNSPVLLMGRPQPWH